MIHSQHSDIYIASCSAEGGIYQFSFFSNGKLKFINKTDLNRPMYMTIDKNRMYVLLREPYTGSKESALVRYDIDEKGFLVNPSKPVPTRGEVACHLTVNNGVAYCTNYISGSIIKIPDTLVVHEGKGVHPIRQKAPHTHFVGYTPDGKYLCVTDLGLDAIFIYTPELKLFSKAFVPEGHGVRHLVFSDDGEFCFSANELLSTVSSFLYKDGKLTYIETINIIPEEFKNISTASAIRYSCGKIYISNRGHNSISVLTHEKGKMDLLGTISCGGNFPRDFEIIGNYIISANEKSNSVTIINKETSEKVCKVTGIEAPICINYR